MSVVALLALAAAGTVGSATPAPWQTGVIIDAGSTGSRVHVYRWQADAPARTVHEVGTTAVKPGVSGDALANGVNAAAAALRPLLEYAVAAIDSPADDVPVSFLATAGMRLMDADTRDALLAAVHAELDASAFRVADVRVIPGEEEALYDWLAVNVALDRHIGGNGGLSSPVAVADLGGASTQLAFAAPPSGAGDTFELASGHTVVGRSRLGLGLHEAYARTLASAQAHRFGACLERGLEARAADGTRVAGAGDYDACLALLTELVLDFDAAQRREGVPRPLSLPSADQWPVYLLDNFALGVATLRNVSAVPPSARFTLGEVSELARAACSRPASELAYLQPAPDAHGFRPCFFGAYAVALLHAADGFPLGPVPAGATTAEAGSDAQGETFRASSQVGELVAVTELGGFAMAWPLGAIMRAAQHGAGLATHGAADAAAKPQRVSTGGSGGASAAGGGRELVGGVGLFALMLAFVFALAAAIGAVMPHARLWLRSRSARAGASAAAVAAFRPAGQECAAAAARERESELREAILAAAEKV